MCIPLYNSINSLNSLYHIPLLPRRINFHVQELSGYLGYYIAGYYFSEYKLKQKTENTIFVLGIISLIFTNIATQIISIHYEHVNEMFMAYIIPNTMFQAYSIFLLFKMNTPEQNAHTERYCWA
jgi:surface polysaccharide O-acyltransferase-like enzyme